MTQIFNSDQPTTSTRPTLGLPEIYITVSEPSIEIVEVGSTIRFRCDARSRRNRVIMIDFFHNEITRVNRKQMQTLTTAYTFEMDERKW